MADSVLLPIEAEYTAKIPVAEELVHEKEQMVGVSQIAWDEGGEGYLLRASSALTHSQKSVSTNMWSQISIRFGREDL